MLRDFDETRYTGSSLADLKCCRGKYLWLRIRGYTVVLCYVGVTRLRSSPPCNKVFGTNTNDRSSDSPAEKETNWTGWSHSIRTTTTPPSTFPSPQQTSYIPVR
ncbi:hypothetical protein AVEN_16663-1 [Araneus ventricosus]|uniref:Uncharacterized protein n=1 Tax=Araneus ventricosus TaxID=182803 RepID=A0A4Y2UXM0_ARAVE|nr:hypothetical protein AVEN_16663-1 [Araneus ventricosus]